jgi:hypothetical protein
MTGETEISVSRDGWTGVIAGARSRIILIWADWVKIRYPLAEPGGAELRV